MKKKTTSASSVSKAATMTKKQITEVDVEIVSVTDKSLTSESANEQALVSTIQIDLGIEKFDPENTTVSHIECVDEPVFFHQALMLKCWTIKVPVMKTQAATAKGSHVFQLQEIKLTTRRKNQIIRVNQVKRTKILQTKIF